MKDFKVHSKAIKLYQDSKNIRVKYYIRDQLLRASSSIALNLAEGDQRRTQKDRLKFFNIALTSLREVQSIIQLEELYSIERQADDLGGMIYSLCRKVEDGIN